MRPVAMAMQAAVAMLACLIACIAVSEASITSPIHLITLSAQAVTPSEGLGSVFHAKGAGFPAPLVQDSQHRNLIRSSKEQQQLQKPLLQDSRPYVVAHRGNSGMLPEHTVPAYTTAIKQGADFIECDVVVTKDLQLICRHEPNLNSTTNAWTLFPDRVATYTIDGEETTGIFASDLTLQEVKRLRARQRWEFRDHSFDYLYEVPTLQEFLDIALSADRAVGIYPEVKHPMWHNQLPQLQSAGTTIEELIIDQLHARGYAASAPVGSAAWRSQPIFIQSFEPTSLKRLSQLTPVPLVLLLGGWPGFTAPDTGMTHEQMISDEFLSELATYVVGAGPWKSSLYNVVANLVSDSSSSSSGGSDIDESRAESDDGTVNGTHSSNSSSSLDPNHCHSIHCSNFIHPDIGRTTASSSGSSGGGSQVQLQSTGLVDRLHKHGLQVHPYTLRDEAQFVPESCSGNIACECAWLFDNEGVDGGFADYPGTLHHWLVARQQATDNQHVKLLHDQLIGSLDVSSG